MAVKAGVGNVPLGPVPLPLVPAPVGDVKAHEAALDDQLRVVDSLVAMEGGVAMSETVGAAGGGLTLTVLVLLAVTPAPLSQVTM